MVTDTAFSPSTDAAIIERLHRVFEAQKTSFTKERDPDFALRKNRIDRTIAMILKNVDRFTEATHADYGSRDPLIGKAVDIASLIDGLKADSRTVKRFMRGERRSSAFPLGLLGGRSRIQYEPLGVIGNISPWNFPIQLSLSMLGPAFGAGNRVLLKPSDQTPLTSQVIEEAIAEYFDETELVAFAGGFDLAVEFPKLPFDHLMFTGSPALARIISTEAAKNLTPTTLELGGKSPVIVSHTADLAEAARRVMWGKCINGGQVCLAPDYAFVAKGDEPAFLEAAEQAVKEMFPTMQANDEYVSFVNDRHYRRVVNYLDDARAKGAKIIEINPAAEEFPADCRKLPLTFVLDLTDDMLITQEEIFGPVILVKTYDEFSDAVNYINNRPKPLALYYFGHDENEWNSVLANTSSGGIVRNDVVVHFMQHDLPFGGVGNSGSGRYHGIDGFRRFSNPRSVYQQSNLAAKAIRLALNFPMKEINRRVVKSKLR